LIFDSQFSSLKNLKTAEVRASVPIKIASCLANHGIFFSKSSNASFKASITKLGKHSLNEVIFSFGLNVVFTFQSEVEGISFKKSQTS
jgi:hypothetical protein